MTSPESLGWSLDESAHYVARMAHIITPRELLASDDLKFIKQILSLSDGYEEGLRRVNYAYNGPPAEPAFQPPAPPSFMGLMGHQVYC